jgi:hypothetical protein
MSYSEILPNLIVIGAAKAGTTSLCHYLNQHPQVHVSPIKEPNFFALEGGMVNFRGPGDEQNINYHSITQLAVYQAHFQPNNNQSIICDGSTLYLSSPIAAKKIKFYTPEAKIIAILRQPAERAFSNFLYAHLRGREPLTDFEDALTAEQQRISQGWGPLWHYKQRGFYFEQLKLYFDLFDQSQIKVYLYEDFITNPLQTTHDIFQFLGINSTFTPDVSMQLNESGMPKNKFLHQLLIHPTTVNIASYIPPKIHRLLTHYLKKPNLVKPKLSPTIRHQLTQIYQPDIINLQNLINHDLAHWLTS